MTTSTMLSAQGTKTPKPMTVAPATDLIALSATELAAMLARGEVSSLETVEAHIARIEQVNPQLNAVVVKCYDTARAEARKADERRAKGESLGALHGVPIAIKECLDLTGTPSTFGLPSRANTLATQDDVYVARLRAAGAIVLGKTNASQMLFFVETDNPLYGRTNNPWNIARSSGGSSGGQGAILAAGGACLGLGTDIGGSVRIPSAVCGTVGLKPTAGRLPDAGRYSAHIGQRAIVSQVGVMARTTGDVALGLEIANSGSNPNVAPPMPLGDYRTVDVSHLRVAYYSDDGTFQVAPAVRRAVREAAETLRARGAQVSEWTPPDAPHALDLFFGILSADRFGSGLRTLGKDKRDPRIAAIEQIGTKPRGVVQLLAKLLGATGQHGTVAVAKNYGYGDTLHYWDLVEAQMAYQQRFAAALDAGQFDVILCPAFALPAVTHGATQDLILAGAYTPLYNVLGYPAGVVPFTRVHAAEEVGRTPSKDKMQQTAYQVEQGSAGLPIGVQVAARPWREHVALAVMNAIEQAARTHSDFPQTPIRL